MLCGPTTAFGLLLRTALMTSALGQLICTTINYGTYCTPFVFIRGTDYGLFLGLSMGNYLCSLLLGLG